MAISHEEFVQAAPRPAFLFEFSTLPIPLEVSRSVAMLWPHVIDAQGIQPRKRDVLPRESKGRFVLKKFLQTPDIVRRLNVVHHGKKNTADGVAQGDGFGDAPAVDADWMFCVRVDVNEMLDGVRRTVLAGFYSDFIQVAEAANHQGFRVLNENFAVKAVHDLMVKLQRSDQRCRWLMGCGISDRPVVLQAQQKATCFAVQRRKRD